MDATEASVTVHLTGDDVSGHLCDAVGGLAHLDGVVRGDGVLEASAPLGTFVLAEIDGDHMTGLITFPDSSEHSFSARLRADPGRSDRWSVQTTTKEHHHEQDTRHDDDDPLDVGSTDAGQR